MAAAENDPVLEVHVRVSEDRLALLVSCAVPEDDVELERVVSEIVRIAEGMGVALPEMTELRERLAALASPEGVVEDGEIVRGVPPTPPRDGYLDWADDFFSPGFVIDERTGAADYRRRKARTSVAEGELLVHVVPPVPGVSGIDIFGKPVAPETPSTPHISAGKNVQYKHDTEEFFAETSGRVRWAGSTLSVDDVLHIEGSIGLETGHVFHPGAVVVEGDIEPESQVKADGDVEVHGMIDNAQVEAGGSISVAGGIAGGEKSVVRARGGVHARFVLDAVVDADQDVTVEKEIVHSHVRTRGAVTIEDGRIVGGRIEALGGVVEAQIGTEGLAPTLIVLGEDFRLHELLEALEQRIRNYEKNLEQIGETIKTLVPRMHMLPPERREGLRQLEAQANKIRAAISKAHEEIERIRQESADRARREAVVTKMLWPEATFVILGEAHKVRESYPGPVAVRFSNDEIGVFPHSRREAKHEGDRKADED